eukprot:TRINITY_DN11312_c0_g1_i8.p1 TRINITY_DN11312_c0_g1~~TRINITY_DN11312_c0_g1_i8.p1  ORF type:complete len:288 (+),score=86.96 TRINITY_DN11312_c0_g1_i8:55-918(+)
MTQPLLIQIAAKAQGVAFEVKIQRSLCTTLKTPAQQRLESYSGELRLSEAARKPQLQGLAKQERADKLQQQNEHKLQVSKSTRAKAKRTAAEKLKKLEERLCRASQKQQQEILTKKLHASRHLSSVIVKVCHASLMQLVFQKVLHEKAKQRLARSIHKKSQVRSTRNHDSATHLCKELAASIQEKRHEHEEKQGMAAKKREEVLIKRAARISARSIAAQKKVDLCRYYKSISTEALQLRLQKACLQHETLQSDCIAKRAMIAREHNQLVCSRMQRHREMILSGWYMC